MIYASTACLSQPRELEAMLDEYERVGIDCVELGHCQLAEADADARDLADRLRRRHFAYAVHNYFPPPSDPFFLNLASGNPDLGERSLSFVLAALELASDLEAPFYSVHAGFVTDPVGVAGGDLVLPSSTEPDALEAAAGRYVERLAVAVTRARELGVVLLVENHAVLPADRGLLLATTASELSALIRDVGAAGTGVLLDTGHLAVTARTLGFDRGAFVRDVAPLVRAVHLHENDGTADRHEPVAASSWAIEALQFVPAADLVVEAHFAEADALRHHVDWLQTLMLQSG